MTAKLQDRTMGESSSMTALSPDSISNTHSSKLRQLVVSLVALKMEDAGQHEKSSNSKLKPRSRPFKLSDVAAYSFLFSRVDPNCGGWRQAGRQKLLASDYPLGISGRTDRRDTAKKLIAEGTSIRGENQEGLESFRIRNLRDGGQRVQKS
jgi:hypothetical protein